MNKENLISVAQLCSYYKVEHSFFSSLNEFGIVEINTIENTTFIHQEKINDIEKIIRLVEELDVNIESVDIVFHLLNKIETLQEELNSMKNKLSQFEN